MKTTQLECPACGAALRVEDKAQRVTCDFCGKQSVLEYNQGQATILAAERLGQAIMTSNTQVSDTIRSSGDVTQLELKRLQLTQDISSCQMLLANVQSEIRSLERQSASKVTKNQLKELHQQEADIKTRISTLQNSLVPQAGHADPQAPGIVAKASRVITWRTGLGWAFLVLMVVGTLFSAIDENVGPVLGLVAAVVFYFWYRARLRKRAGA